MRSRSRGKTGEFVLHRSDLVEEASRIERQRDPAQALLHRVGHGRRLQQTRARRLGRVIPLADSRAFTLLLCQLERRLVEIHERSRRGVQPGEFVCCSDPCKASIADEATDDCSVLLLDPCLVVLSTGRPRVNSVPSALPYASTVSLMNSLPLSVSKPQRGNGIVVRSLVSASTISAPSLTASAIHSVHPLAISRPHGTRGQLP